MHRYSTHRNAPLGNPKPLMRLWDTEGYLPRYSTHRSTSFRSTSRRNSTLRLSRRFGAGMAGKPFNHAARRLATLRSATQRIKRKDK
jgi:hypothetical protein